MKTARLFDYSIFNSNEKDAISVALRLIEGNKPAQIVTINPEMINLGFKNEEFASLLQEADLLLPDGVGIKLALSIMGEKSSRIAGVDLAYKLLQECEKSGDTVALIGASENVITKTIEKLNEKMPDLKIVYSHNGFFEDENILFEELKKNAPALTLVALGSPKQEFFIQKAKKHLKNGLLIGVGGSFDVWSGEVKRAPKIYQKLGLEWLYRTISQPQRFKRIFPALPLFLLKVIRTKIGV